MKIILSGATGLIGKALIKALSADHQLVVIGRNRKHAMQLIGDSAIDYVDWSLPVDTLAAVMAGSNALINLAGAGIADKRWTEARKNELISSRIDPVYKLTCLLKSAGIQLNVVIQASAIGYYGNRPNEVVNEKSRRGNGFLSEITEIWEGAASEFLHITDRVVMLRTGVVLAREGGALPKLARPVALFAGGRLGSGKQQISWIHLEDEVRAIVHLLHNESSTGAYNLCAPHPVSQAELIQSVGKVLHRPVWLPVPAFILTSFMGRMAREVLLEGNAAIPEKLLAEDFTFIFAEVTPALRNLLTPQYD
ncbi:MAG: TIGR01777 family oxidoreductase [Bacteroidales bacterium]|nr:TIGR01777 family oxidoreductase [Bacteroidales bacterium]